MAGNVQSEMSTRIAIDTISAVGSLKGFKDAISSATSAWKANEVALKSSGDTFGSLKTKVDGLNQVIDLQKSKIAELKSRQEGLDTSTKNGAESYLKLQKQIDSATKQISSLESQQERAKQSMTYYSSGLADLQKGYQAAANYSKSYVERLQAEGKEEEASKAKLSGLKSALNNLSEQYSKQEEELKRIASESGATSDAYLKQKTRLNETATSIAKTKSEMNELNSSMKDEKFSLVSSALGKLQLHYKKVDEEHQKFWNHIKEFAIGDFLGRQLSSAATSIYNFGKNIVETGYEIDEAGEKISKQWSNIGLSSGQTQGMLNQIKDIRNESNMSGSAVDKLQKSLYGLTGNVADTQKLTNELSAFGKEAGLSDDKIAGLGTKMSRVFSSSSVSLSTFNRTFASMPGLKEAIQKASGMSSDTFTKALQNSKISGQQMEQYMVKASSESGKAWKAFGDTTQGEFAKLQGQWTSMKAVFAKPLAEGAAKGIEEVLSAISNSKGGLTATGKQLTSIVQSLSVKAGKGIEDAISFLIKNQKPIGTIASSLYTIIKYVGSGVWNTFKSILGDIAGKGNTAKKGLSGVAGALKDLSKNKGLLKGIGAAFVIGFPILKIVQFTSSLVSLARNLRLVAGAQKLMNAAAKANIYVTIAAAIVAVIAALVELYKHNAKFRTFVNGLIKSAQEAWKNVVKYFKALWKDTVGIVTKMYKGVTGWFSNMKKGISNHVSDAWKNTKSAFSNGWKDTKKLTSDGVSKVGDWFNNMRKNTINIASNLWKNQKGTFKGGYTTLNSYTQTWHDIMTGKWGKVGSDIKNTTNDFIKTVKSFFTGMYDWLNKITGGRLGDVLNTFKSIFGSISGVISGAVKGVKHAFGDIVRGILSPFNDLLSGLEKGINWVLDKVGANKIKGSWHIDVPSYATGTKGGVLHDQLALVNDAKGSKYREMYHTPDGQIGMFPAQRNMIVPLKAGTEILDAENSAKLAKLMGLNNYASGSIGSFFSGLWNKGKDLLEDADKIIAHPMEFLDSVFSKFTNGIKASTGLATDIISNFPSTIAKSAVNWVKKLFSDDVGNIKGTATPAQAKEVIEKAMGLAGVSGSNWLNGLETIAKYESGFRNVTNNWDSNAKAGHPSSGWFQMIESTFKAYAKAGYTNWTNPMDQAISAIGYIKSRYGGIGNVPGIKSLAKGRKYVGYANGGIVSTEGLYQLAEGNKSEYVIPTDYSKHDRAVQLLDSAKRVVTGSGLDNSAAEKLDTLVEQNNTLISILNTMLSKTMNVNFNGKMIGELYPEFDKQGYNSNAYQQRNVWR